MTFELTESLVNSIIFSMEDQTTKRLMDAKTCSLVEIGSGDETVKQDSYRYYSLPQWTSGDGYGLLEDFTESVHDTEIKAELKQVLVNGRGVFRNFKNVVKASPDLQRQFNVFKSGRMKARVVEWYNSLRESWGLESFEEDFDVYSDEYATEELLLEDFGFEEYDSLRDKECIIRERNVMAQQAENQQAHEIGSAEVFFKQKQLAMFDQEEKNGFVCRSQSEEFAGCLLTCHCASSSKKTVLATDFFVVQNFRGLGIGKELVSKCLSDLKEREIQLFLISISMIPEFMEPALIQMGFEKQGLFFVADLVNLF